MDVTGYTSPSILPIPQILSSREDKTHLRFTIANVDTSIANGLRRLILNDVPCVVIRSSPYESNHLEFLANTTRHTNEILKQRISSIPIHIKDLTTPIDQLILEVDKQNDSDAIQYVTTDDFTLMNQETSTPIDKNETQKIFPHDPITNDPILVARLRPKIRQEGSGEHLHFRAKFSIGSGKESGMFIQASTCAYGMTVNEERQAEEWDREANRLQKEAGEQGMSLTEDQLDFERKNWYLGNGKRITIPDHFDFTIESIGVFSNHELVRIACQSMFAKLDTLQRTIREQTIPIKKSNTTLKYGFDITLENEDYTLGKAIEYALYTMFYQGRKESVFSYVGFRKEHPHDSHSILRIGCKDQTEPTSILQYLMEASTEIRNVYGVIHDSV